MASKILYTNIIYVIGITIFLLLFFLSDTIFVIAVGTPRLHKVINKLKVGRTSIYLLMPSVPIVLVRTILIAIPSILVIRPPIINIIVDLTNLFLVFAEDEAKQRHVMTMKNWIDATDDLLKFRRKEILNNSGSISHMEAVEKAEKEYEKFRVIQDQKYISSMDEFYSKYLNETKMIEKGSESNE